MRMAKKKQVGQDMSEPAEIILPTLEMWREGRKCLLVKDLVRSAGIEPTTPGFGGQYSIH